MPEAATSVACPNWQARNWGEQPTREAPLAANWEERKGKKSDKINSENTPNPNSRRRKKPQPTTETTHHPTTTTSTPSIVLFVIDSIANPNLGFRFRLVHSPVLVLVPGPPRRQSLPSSSGPPRSSPPPPTPQWPPSRRQPASWRGRLGHHSRLPPPLPLPLPTHHHAWPPLPRRRLPLAHLLRAPRADPQRPLRAPSAARPRATRRPTLATTCPRRAAAPMLCTATLWSAPWALCPPPVPSRQSRVR